MNVPHEIRRLTIQFSSPVSETYKRQLEQDILALLERIFDRYFPGEEVSEISSISLDLGTIPKDGFNFEFRRRLDAYINDEFLKLTSNAPTPIVQSEDKPSLTLHQQLSNYLLRGYAKGFRGSLNELFRLVLEKDPNGLEALLANLQSSSVVRLRILNQVDIQWIERYWSNTYGSAFSVINKINTSFMERLVTSGYRPVAVRKLLHHTTYEFLVSGDVWERTEQRYLSKVQQVLSNASARADIPVKTIHGIFQTGSKPQQLNKRSDLDTFIRFAKRGVTDRRGLPQPDLQTVRYLAEWVASEKTIMSVSISRILSVLRPSQVRYFLQTLERKGIGRIGTILYISNLLKRLFTFDLFDDYRAEVGQVLGASGQDQEDWNGFFDQVLRGIGARNGLANDQLNLRLSQAIDRSFHKEVVVLRTWLKSSSQGRTRSRRPEDPLNTWINFMRTGSWSGKGSPQRFFSSQLKDSPSTLLASWRTISNMNLAWSRLFFQHQWSDVSSFLNLAYPDDPTILLLRNRITDSTTEQKVLQAFLQLRQDIGLSPEDFKAEFNRRLKAIPGAIEENLFSPPEDLSQEDGAGENYVRMFIHWIRYGTFLSADLEALGPSAAISRARTATAAELIRQLRAQSDLEQLIMRLWLLLPEEEQSLWFDMLAPRFRERWPVMARMSQKFQVDPSDLFVRIIAISLANADIGPTDYRLDKVTRLLSSDADEVKLDDWLSLTDPSGDVGEVGDKGWMLQEVAELNDQTADRIKAGISVDHRAEFSFSDLVQFVLQHREFPSWSTIYAPIQFADLLIEVVRRQPGHWSRFFADQFRISQRLENLLALLGTDRTMQIISEVWSAAARNIRESIEPLAAAHRTLGDEQAIREYFASKLLKERYRDQVATWGEIVQQVLQGVGADFGYTLEEYRRLLAEQNSTSEAIRIYQARPSEDLEINGPVDVLLHLVLVGESPWWAPQSNLNQISELIREALNDNAQNFFRKIERTPDSTRFYRSIFSRIDTDLFLKMTEERFPYAVGTLRFAASILSHWPSLQRLPGWFNFSWNWLTKTKWDAAVYASEFVDFLASINRLESAIAAKQLLDVIPTVGGQEDQKRIFRVSAEVLLSGSQLPVRTDVQLTDDGWNILLKSYLQSGALPQDPAYRIVSFSSFIKGIEGYVKNNVDDTARAVRENLAAESIFNRVVWNEPSEFLELILRATIGDRLWSLNKYWDSVRPIVESLYSARTDNWWTRQWSAYLLDGVRSGRKLSPDDHHEVAYFLLKLEIRINIPASFSVAQLVDRGLPEILVGELSKGGSKLLSAPAESVTVFPVSSKSEWESALRNFLTSGSWPIGFSAPKRLPLPVILRRQSAFNAAELRQVLLKLFGEQTVWSAWRKRNDLESSEGLIELLFPADFTDLLNLGDLLIELLLRTWPVLSTYEVRWAFFQHLVDAARNDISTRLILARFAGNTIDYYGLDAAVVVTALRGSGYPVQWLDGFLAEAGLAESTEIPTPVQLVAEKVAFFDPQATLDHYLRTGAWPVNVEQAGLNLTTFLSKARQQPAYRAAVMLNVIQRAVGDDQIRRRLAAQGNYNTFRALRDFIYPKLSPEFETLREVTIKLLIRQPEEKVVLETSYAVLGLMAAPYSEFTPFGQALLWVMRQIKGLYGADKFRRDDLVKADFPLSWIQVLEKSDGMIYADGDSAEQVKVALGEADLLIFLLIERELPWWAEKFGVSDVKEETIRRLLRSILRTDPGSLVNRIQRDAQPEVLLNLLTPHLDQAGFFILLSAWPAAVKQAVVPLTRLIASVFPSLEPSLWYAFVAGQLVKPRTFVVDEFVTAGLSYLERLSGRSMLELYQEFTSSESVRLSSDRDVQKILDEISGLISGTPDADEKVLARTPVLDFNQVVLSYLRTGTLPLGQLSDIQSRAGFLQYLRYQISLGNSGLADILRLAVRESATRERLLRHENSELLGLIAQVLFPQLFRALDQYRRLLYRFFRNQNQLLTEERFNQGYYGALFKLYSEQITDADGIDKVFSLVFRSLKIFLQYSSVIRADSLRRFGFSTDILDALIRNDAGVEAVLESSETSDGLLDGSVEVRNAGLVILWPYLGRYFDLLEMTEKGEFKSEDVASRAALLLQFIATGISTADEHELLLNKLLCGISPGIPVPREIDLTDKEKEITEMMLKGVLQNWEKLRNSSIDALREGFLVRDGYLREKETLWELQVEKKTLDILMKSMPWSFGTVKLPWMKKRLVVEWL